jgi:predicted RNase H-like HicB family nuclease
MTAKELAQLPYFAVVFEDKDTAGNLCFLAANPELPGCLSHGETPDGALENLQDARELYLELLLDQGLEVPLPVSRESVTMGEESFISSMVIEGGPIAPQPAFPCVVLSLRNEEEHGCTVTR